TGFQANYAALSALAEKGDALVCDHTLHASLLEGAMRSTARTVRFRHNDLVHLERCLQNCSSDERVLIVSEGVFSMEGDLADLPGIVSLARKYHARTYVDEAHGIGVLGANGAGAAEYLGVLDDVDIVMGTFSKSLASVGGFVAGPTAVIDYLKHTARPFVFSARLPAASVASVGAGSCARDHAHGAGTAETPGKGCEPTTGRVAAAGLHCAGWHHANCSSGDSERRRPVPIMQVAARRRNLHQSGPASGGLSQPAA